MAEEARIVSLQLCTGHRQPMRFVESASLVAGYGIEGDRHATSTGGREARQVLLMDEETLVAFGLEHGAVRENITTSGLDLGALKKGQRLTAGDSVVLEITGLCTPCSRMDEVRPGLQVALEGRRGVLARVVQGGSLRTGDSIRVSRAVAVP